MTIGQMVRSFLLKLEWYGTLFPRIPVPVQKDIEVKLREKGLCDDHKRTAQDGWGEAEDFVRRTRVERWVSRKEEEYLTLFCFLSLLFWLAEKFFSDHLSVRMSVCVVLAFYYK